MRCTLRISQRGMFVDGEPTARADAVAYCKATPGGAVVVVETYETSAWDPTTRAMIVSDDTATQAEWTVTRAALEREGVRIYVRGPLCPGPNRFDCRPRAPVQPAEPRPHIDVTADPPRALVREKTTVTASPSD